MDQKQNNEHVQEDLSTSNSKESQGYVMDTFSELFNKFSEKTLAALKESKEFRNDGLLYHYTSLQTLQAIIENQSFRATSIFMLNDPNELLHGHDYWAKWYCKEVNVERSRWDDRYKSYHGFSAFVFSLSELDDNMHMWEKYGNNHKGVRIGFSRTEVVDFWKQLKHVDVILVPVVYQQGDGNFIGPYASAFEEFRNELVRRVNAHFRENDVSSTNAQHLAWCTSLISTLMKRQEWAPEREWRVVILPGGFAHSNIIGDFSTGEAIAKLEIKSSKVLPMLRSHGPKRPAHRNVLKIGAHAGEKKHVQYTIQLLVNKSHGGNYFDDNISQSRIQTR